MPFFVTELDEHRQSFGARMINPVAALCVPSLTVRLWLVLQHLPLPVSA